MTIAVPRQILFAPVSCAVTQKIIIKKKYKKKNHQVKKKNQECGELAERNPHDAAFAERSSARLSADAISSFFSPTLNKNKKK